MRHICTYSLLLAAAMFALPGCDQRVPRGDLGNIIYRLPDVPGANKPYELPELKGMKSVDEAAVAIPRPA
jgi:hypothetical protein